MLSKRGILCYEKLLDGLFMKWLERLEIFNDAVRWLSQGKKDDKECHDEWKGT